MSSRSRRWPVTALAAATVFLAVTSRGIQSIERYAASAIPLLLVAAVWLCTERRLRVAGTTAALPLGAASLLASLHLYVPRPPARSRGRRRARAGGHSSSVRYPRFGESHRSAALTVQPLRRA